MRILLADDESRVRSALRLLLEQELGEQVVGEAVDGASLVEIVHQTRPDLLLLDWELPRLVETTVAVLRAILPSLKIIVLSGRPEKIPPPALTASVDAFLSKSDPPDRLLKVLRRLANKCAGVEEIGD